MTTSTDHCLSSYHFDLPPDRIAQHPATERTASRLLVCDPKNDHIEPTTFDRITDILQPGDLLVLNDSRVLPCRIYAKRQTGGQVELLLLTPEGNGAWTAMGRPAGRLRPDEILTTDAGTALQIQGRTDDGLLRVGPVETQLEEIMEREGLPPLPPYIQRNYRTRKEAKEDLERYQTVYANEPGSAAAPTAGLHFSNALLSELASKGVERCAVTLHVGPGTFRPVQNEAINEHRMHAEAYSLTAETAEALNNAQQEGRRIIAVGTTATRVLESCWSSAGFSACRGWTDIYIYPGYTFKAIKGLITNFHLPQSSLMLLVSALAGREFILRAYASALDLGFHFYSYGDAMMLFPGDGQ